MTNNCKCRRITDPAGVWSVEDLIGSRVYIVSTSIANFLGGFDCQEDHIIEEVKFRVSVDGKAITIIKLKDVDATFTLKDLEFIDILEKTEAIAGETIAGQTIAGYKNSLENQLKGKMVEIKTEDAELVSGAFQKFITEE